VVCKQPGGGDRFHPDNDTPRRNRAGPGLWLTGHEGYTCKALYQESANFSPIFCCCRCPAFPDREKPAAALPLAPCRSSVFPVFRTKHRKNSFCDRERGPGQGTDSAFSLGNEVIA
jgi:hypothetical protein